jgi:hypothetical protein
MVYYQTKNPNLGIFWRALEWKRLVHSLAIWNILQPLGTFFGHLVIYILAIWYILPRFGILCQEKSGNPALDLQLETWKSVTEQEKNFLLEKISKVGFNFFPIRKNNFCN